MAVKVFFAPPGPESEKALTRYWSLVHEVADEILARERAEQQKQENKIERPKAV